MAILGTWVLVFVFARFHIAIADESAAYIDPSVAEDIDLSVPELITKYGFSPETHIVQTEDGYKLTIYRILPADHCENVKGAIILQHGLLGSAYDFIILGPQKSLAYILAQNCYDVWLGNNRGNRESTANLNITSDDVEYWDFSWHEMGQYDLPAIIDSVLMLSNQSKVHYLGYSQGTTQFFVFAALHPEYHHKIASMHALAPVVFMQNLGNLFIKIMAIFREPIEVLMRLVGVHQFMPQSDFLNLIGSKMCHEKYPDFIKLCSNVLYLFSGFDEPQLNLTILPAILSHVPAGASTKQFVHFAQQIVGGKFRHFDYGTQENLRRYNSKIPPEYDLKNINVPIAMYHGNNDMLSSVKDAKALLQILPNVVEFYQVPYKKFTHLDFIFANDVKFLLYDKLLKVLEKC